MAALKAEYARLQRERSQLQGDVQVCLIGCICIYIYILYVYICQIATILEKVYSQ